LTIPYRGQTSRSTYFVTANTFRKKNLLQSERMASLFCETLFHYRDSGKFLLHEFVVMPNHFHLLLTIPEGMTLERAMQCVKGGFSYRARKLVGDCEIWQTSFLDRRVRDSEEYRKFQRYVQQNPAAAGLDRDAPAYRCSSGYSGYTLDDVPQGLKPKQTTVPFPQA